MSGHDLQSGNPSPSPEAIATTAKLMAAATLLGLPALDHVIVTRDSRPFHSMEMRGMLPPEA